MPYVFTHRLIFFSELSLPLEPLLIRISKSSSYLSNNLPTSLDLFTLLSYLAIDLSWGSSSSISSSSNLVLLLVVLRLLVLLVVVVTYNIHLTK